MTADISRRITLAWIAAASASPFAAQAQDTAADIWRDAALPPIAAPGYGSDPSLTSPVVPWPLTLDAHQRAMLRAIADLMLPADEHSPSAATLPVDAFIDEWISAPYPQQQRDRALIVPGLAWLDADATHRFGTDFLQSSEVQRRAIFDTVAFRQTVTQEYRRPALFFARLRGLMLAGFYSLPEGMADLGYRGNTPSLGDYPGPTDEALAHLHAGLASLGLKPVTPG